MANREHIIALEPLGKGILGTTLRYDYEVRDEKDVFAKVPNPRVPKEMLELAEHILETKAGHFDPKSFKDDYELALRKLVNERPPARRSKHSAPRRTPEKLSTSWRPFAAACRVATCLAAEQIEAQRNPLAVPGIGTGKWPDGRYEDARCQFTPAQSRAARGLMDWSQAELAARSNLSESTVRDFEKGRRLPTINNIEAVRHALEAAGVEFIAENGGGPGVRLRKTARGAEEISRQIDVLEDKISSMPAPTEPSPEAGMNIMRKAVAKNDLAKLKIRRNRIRSDRSK